MTKEPSVRKVDEALIVARESVIAANEAALKALKALRSSKEYGAVHNAAYRAAYDATLKAAYKAAFKSAHDAVHHAAWAAAQDALETVRDNLQSD